MASEFFSLSDRERFDLVEVAIQKIEGRVPVIACVQGLTVHHAREFAEYARAQGADGLMAMPPYLRKPSRQVTLEYYRELASFDLPVIVQNAPPPVGTPLDPETLADLARSAPRIAYLKEETPPILQRISRTLERAGDALDGVFGGANGLYLTDELRRGACGNMPAGGLIDLQVKVYNLWVAGRRHEAEVLHQRLLPLLSLASAYGVSFHKYLLWKRGVLSDQATRDPQATPLDDQDQIAVEVYWRAVADEAIDVNAG
jgi:4-hydroxy-tetrahydrodipicolinate synthase